MKNKEPNLFNWCLLFTIALLTLGVCLLVTGCSTSQQSTAFNAMSSLELVVDTGYTNYLHLVITGQIPTNSVPTISKAYNDVHAAIGAAAVVDQAGTNVLLEANLTAEAGAFGTLVATAIANK